jgi:hypothetical protein
MSGRKLTPEEMRLLRDLRDGNPVAPSRRENLRCLRRSLVRMVDGHLVLTVLGREKANAPDPGARSKLAAAS